MPSYQNSVQQGTLTTGSFNSYDCASYDTSNQGCGVRDMTNDNSYGVGFNNGGGGVYASKSPPRQPKSPLRGSDVDVCGDQSVVVPPIFHPLGHHQQRAQPVLLAHARRQLPV